MVQKKAHIPKLRIVKRDQKIREGFLNRGVSNSCNKTTPVQQLQIVLIDAKRMTTKHFSSEQALDRAASVGKKLQW